MGALTSKPYAFISRPWELKSIESVDVFDSYLSSIRYDYRGTQILRVLPSINSQLNSEWITDKVRFHYDAVTHQRLSNPWVKSNLISIYLNQFKKNPIFDFGLNSNQLIPTSWIFFLELMQYGLNVVKSSNELKFISLFGPSEGLKSLDSNLNLTNIAGSSNLLSTSFFNSRNSYFFNLSKLLKSEICFIINTNIRLELPLLNLKLRELVNSSKLEVFIFGSNLNLNFVTKTVGNSSSSFYEFISGRSLLSVYLLKFSNPFFIFGTSNKNSLQLKKLFDLTIYKYLNKDYPSTACNLLFNNTTSINLSEFGFFQHNHLNLNLSNSNLFYLTNFDNLDFSNTLMAYKLKLAQKNLLSNVIVYAGSHGDVSAEFADFVVPISSSSEFADFYLNLELKIKNTKIVIPPIFNQIRSKVAFNNIFRFLIIQHYQNNLLKINNFNYLKYKFISDTQNYLFNEGFYKINFNSLRLINNSYLTDSVTRSSQFLTLAYNNFKQKFKNFKN